MGTYAMSIGGMNETFSNLCCKIVGRAEDRLLLI